ncbi:hypothetical protein BJ973_001737 [Actinoplanes tereljensis]|uniref:Uncharacterized protein n=1 Tax=Paractinoplanes tereljensis TaxID=571912 RepID=A0A919NM50_9ACTN|nr:hypothetical protein [Actinoplanes tereljensis]GIF20357.1 hypothetical protein Ate02nite_30870 [Actinoplanes tereljensis]
MRPPELTDEQQDVDARSDGRSALWSAVHSRRHDNARALATAGANPWQPMTAGWSPGRLNLAGPEPDLFGPAPTGVKLTPAEREAVALAAELAERLQVDHFEGIGLLAVAGIDAPEAIRRLNGTPMTEDELLAHYDVEVDEEPEPGVEDDWNWLSEMNDLLLVGVTEIPGGCVLTQRCPHRRNRRSGHKPAQARRCAPPADSRPPTYRPREHQESPANAQR